MRTNDMKYGRGFGIKVFCSLLRADVSSSQSWRDRKILESGKIWIRTEPHLCIKPDVSHSPYDLTFEAEIPPRGISCARRMLDTLDSCESGTPHLKV